jgi:hypothetical protein
MDGVEVTVSEGADLLTAQLLAAGLAPESAF